MPLISISGSVSDRSRNASTASGHQIPDSKIFSVAVEAKAKEPQTGLDSMMVCDVDTDYTGRFAVVSSEKTPKRVKHAPPSKELKIDEKLDQVVSNLPEVIFIEYRISILRFLLFSCFFKKDKDSFVHKRRWQFISTFFTPFIITFVYFPNNPAIFPWQTCLGFSR